MTEYNGSGPRYSQDVRERNYGGGIGDISDFNCRCSKAKTENDKRFMDIVFYENILRRQGI